MFRSLVILGAMLALHLPHALAQSGVLSGPPQVKSTPVWIAVSGGFDGRGRYVGVGYSGQHPSKAEAEIAAITSCNKYGRGVRCREAYAKSEGCIYIVAGSRRGGVTWGRGATHEQALSECRQGGYRCNRNRVIGGCVSD